MAWWHDNPKKLHRCGGNIIPYHLQSFIVVSNFDALTNPSHKPVGCS